MRDYPYTENVDVQNPLVHNREGLLTAVTRIPERYIRKEDFMRQLISQPNRHGESMFGITYDSYSAMDGKFQVIGEIVEGWDTLIEIECACVQPISYFYPNNQHLIALAEQTGTQNDPVMIERIAMGLQTDTYVPGLIEAQLSIDAGDVKDSHPSSNEPSDGRSVVPRPSRSREQLLKDIPIAVRPALESAETAALKEREKWEAWDKKSQLDTHSMNKFQGFSNLERKHEEPAGSIT